MSFMPVARVVMRRKLVGNLSFGRRTDKWTWHKSGEGHSGGEKWKKKKNRDFFSLLSLQLLRCRRGVLAIKRLPACDLFVVATLHKINALVIQRDVRSHNTCRRTRIIFLLFLYNIIYYIFCRRLLLKASARR